MPERRIAVEPVSPTRVWAKSLPPPEWGTLVPLVPAEAGGHFGRVLDFFDDRRRGFFDRRFFFGGFFGRQGALLFGDPFLGLGEDERVADRLQRPFGLGAAERLDHRFADLRKAGRWFRGGGGGRRGGGRNQQRRRRQRTRQCPGSAPG